MNSHKASMYSYLELSERGRLLHFFCSFWRTARSTWSESWKMSFCCLGVGLLLSVSRRDSSSFCPVKWLFQMMQAGRFNDPLPMMCRESDRGCSIVKPNASSSPYSLPDALAGTLCCYCSFPGMKKRECTTYRRTLLAFVCQVPSYWTGKTKHIIPRLSFQSGIVPTCPRLTAYSRAGESAYGTIWHS